MKCYIKVLAIVFALACGQRCHAEAAGGADTLRLSLDRAIAMARASSVDAAVARNQLREAYWNYRTYRADLLPEMDFAATIPSYRKSYSSYQLEDGRYTFVRNNVMQMTGEVSITQNIWLTGGSLSLTTSLDWLRQLDAPAGTANRFMAVPVVLRLNQPILGVNSLKWRRRIEPVRYREALAQYISQTEGVAMSAITNYFNLLMAEVNLDIARQNFENSVKLYEVAEAMYGMGQISRNDLLQLELNRLSAEGDLTSALTDMKASMFALRSFLGISQDVEVATELPGEIALGEVAYPDVLEKALDRNALSASLRRRQLEADYSVATAKGNRRQIDLFAQVGFTGADSRLGGAYGPLKDNQMVEIGFKIPILDWGKREGKVKVAQSNRDVVESRLRKERLDFEQDIFILVERFNHQRRQLALAERADTISARRYDTNVETFLVGRISTLDLNDSRVSKDENRRSVIDRLYLAWYYYYQLRSLTLWDYLTDTPIEPDLEIKG